MTESDKAQDWIRYFKTVPKMSTLIAVKKNDGPEVLRRVLTGLGLTSLSGLIEACKGDEWWSPMTKLNRPWITCANPPNPLRLQRLKQEVWKSFLAWSRLSRKRKQEVLAMPPLRMKLERRLNIERRLRLGKRRLDGMASTECCAKLLLLESRLGERCAPTLERRGR